MTASEPLHNTRIFFSSLFILPTSNPPSTPLLALTCLAVFISDSIPTAVFTVFLKSAISRFPYALFHDPFNPQVIFGFFETVTCAS